MTKSAKPSEKPRPDGIEGFFTYMQHSYRDSIEKLTPSDRKKIRRIASGEIAEVNRGDRVRAFRAVADLGSRRDAGILSAVVADRGEESTVRAAAAANLGFFSPKIAEAELIGRLSVKDHLVRCRVIRSLGMIGGGEAYRALEKLGRVRTEFIAKQLTFAKALIAYRHNLDAEPMRFVEGAARRRGAKDELLQLTVKPVRARTVGAAMKRFEGSRYGIELAETTGFEVAAGKAKWMLFINKDPAEKGIVKAIGRRKLIMGLLSHWMEEGESYDTQYVVLTRPAGGNDVEIMVVRSDGELFYSGRATVDKSILSFLVSDIKRAGTAPTKVRGKLTARGIELELTLPVAVRKGKRLTQSIRPEVIRQRRQ